MRELAPTLQKISVERIQAELVKMVVSPRPDLLREAYKLGITKQTVSNWENDNIQPSIEMLIKLTKVFCVSADNLLGLTPETALNVDGLPTEFVSHIVQIINDYKAK